MPALRLVASGPRTDAMPASVAKRSPLVNPFLMWSGLAAMTAEMMLASTQFSSHRGAPAAADRSTPGAGEPLRFRPTGLEPFEAAVESSRAVAVQMARLNLLLWTRTLGQMQAGAAAAMSLAASPGFAGRQAAP